MSSPAIQHTLASVIQRYIVKWSPARTPDGAKVYEGELIATNCLAIGDMIIQPVNPEEAFAIWEAAANPEPLEPVPQRLHLEL
jgi:hypothetical protein